MLSTLKKPMLSFLALCQKKIKQKDDFCDAKKV